MKGLFVSLVCLLFPLGAFSQSDRTWIGEYSACYHAVNKVPKKFQQTESPSMPYPPDDLKSGQLEQLKRFSNAEHIMGKKDGKNGLFLLTGNESLFIPLEQKPLTVDLFPKDSALRGHYVQDQYFIKLEEANRLPLYIDIQIEKPSNKKNLEVSSVQISFRPSSDHSYQSEKGINIIDSNLREQFRKKLITKISRMTDDQQELMKEFVEHNQHLNEGLTPGETYFPMPTEDYREALSTCRDIFKDAELKDQHIKEAIAAEIKKFDHENGFDVPIPYTPSDSTP
jgi:hypothetical protein